MIQVIMRIIAAVLGGYMLLILIRILMTWFHSPQVEHKTELLARVTDPYLQYFRRFKWLQFRNVDFSPILGILILGIAFEIAMALATQHEVWFGMVAGLIVARVWGAVGFIVFVLFVLCLIRVIGLLIGSNSVSPFWRGLDMILQPMLYRLAKFFLRSETISYMQGLLIGGASFIIVWALGSFLFNNIANLLYQIPF